MVVNIITKQQQQHCWPWMSESTEWTSCRFSSVAGLLTGVTDPEWLSSTNAVWLRFGCTQEKYQTLYVVTRLTGCPRKVLVRRYQGYFGLLSSEKHRSAIDAEEKLQQRCFSKHKPYQTRTSEGPNTSSMWIWRKSIQRFQRFWHTNKKSHNQRQKQNLTQFTACCN